MKAPKGFVNIHASQNFSVDGICGVLAMINAWNDDLQTNKWSKIMTIFELIECAKNSILVDYNGRCCYVRSSDRRGWVCIEEVDTGDHYYTRDYDLFTIVGNKQINGVTK